MTIPKYPSTRSTTEGIDNYSLIWARWKEILPLVSGQQQIKQPNPLIQGMALLSYELESLTIR